MASPTFPESIVSAVAVEEVEELLLVAGEALLLPDPS
jgi:hypothetical protein